MGPEPVTDGPPTGAAELLLRAFAEKPYSYDEDRIARRLASWSDWARIPGFRVVTARGERRLLGIGWSWDSVLGSDEQPTMFGDLYTTMAEQPWSRRLVGTELVEVAVDPDARGSGVGRTLIDRLVGEGPEWLLAHPQAPAAGW